MNVTQPADTARPRLASLDALRGFDMFWIVGGREALGALLALSGLDGLTSVFEHHTEHAPWHGFRAWDLVFPLFLFLAGVSTAFSFESRRAGGLTRKSLFFYALRRGLLLVLLGAVYNGLLNFDFANQRWASVLGRIGLAWMLAAWITLTTGTRGRLLWAAGLLLGYWALMMLVPVPVHGAGDLTRGHSLADWIDQRIVPGRLHRGDHDPEGLFSTLPAIATALLGTLAGTWLRRADLGATRRLAGLLAAGLGLLAAGYLWSLWFPLNKRLWTSSFVLVCGGWSLVLLALFHALFDLHPASGAARRVTFVLSVIGAHSLAAYMTARFVDYEALARLIGGGAIERSLLHEAWIPLMAVALLWGTLLVWHLSRQRRRHLAGLCREEV